MEKILCAAILAVKRHPEAPVPFDGHFDIWDVETGYRHSDILIKNHGWVQKHPNAQGFLTSYGRFVNRKEAKEIAEQAGQLPNGTISNVLTSEDLYWDEIRMEPTKRGK